MELNKIYNMDCIEGMKQLPENSVDSIVTDPPYGLGFMGKQWDTYDKTQFGNKGAEGKNDLKVKKNFNTLPRYRSDNSFYEFSYTWAREAFRVLKPGGFLLSFGGTRTYHRMACGIEDAGFEIRDQMQWIYGSGFPKSLNIGKAIDKLQGNKRVDLGINPNSRNTHKGIESDYGNIGYKQYPYNNLTKGNSKWEGWGTALKPANEPIVVARKPLSEKTVAKNVLKWGTGGINIDACRIGTNEKLLIGSNNHSNAIVFNHIQKLESKQHYLGRFPANVIHDGSDEVVSLFPSNKGAFAPVKKGQKGFGGLIYGKYNQAGDDGKTFYKDGLGSASRFFYCAKVSKSERNIGLDKFDLKQLDESRKEGNPGGDNPRNRGVNKVKNIHPTVKPLKLMQYLVRLVTPKGGVVLDPFMGSGTTDMASKSQGFNYIGFDMTKEYCDIAEARIKAMFYQTKFD